MEVLEFKIIHIGALEYTIQQKGGFLKKLPVHLLQHLNLKVGSLFFVEVLSYLNDAPLIYSDPFVN